MSVKKSSVSFNPEIWQQLTRAKNKSKVVNEALKLYFSINKFKANKELEYSEAEAEFLMAELEHHRKTGESYEYEAVFNRDL